MAAKKHSSLDRVLGRLDTLDPVNLTNLVQRLARERSLFEQIFNTLHEGILLLTADGEIEYANDAAHPLLGAPAEPLAGTLLWRLVPGLRPALDPALTRAEPAALVQEIELTYPEPRALRLSLVPFRGEGKDERRRFAVILTDITREKHSTAELIENERTASVLLLAAGVAHELGNPLNSLTIHLQLIERQLRKLTTLQATSSPTTSSPSATSNLTPANNRPPSAGNPATHAYPAPVQASHYATQPAAVSLQPPHSATNALPNPATNGLTAGSSLTPPGNASAVPPTRRRPASKTSRKTHPTADTPNRPNDPPHTSASSLAATPQTSTPSTSTALALTVPSPAQPNTHHTAASLPTTGIADPTTASVAESVRICRQEVARLDGILTHFLSALRPQPPQLADTDLAEVLAEVLRFQQDELADAGITIEVETPATLPAIQADRDQLKQVFFNLIKNAREAMRPGGQLHIRTRADDEHLYLLFADTGSGIRSEDLPKLFQPYYTTKTTGHGLGLMIVQRILRAHGGRVSIESKEGAGTVVTLQFPQKHRRIRMLQ